MGYVPGSSEKVIGWWHALLPFSLGGVDLGQSDGEGGGHGFGLDVIMREEGGGLGEEWKWKCAWFTLRCGAGSSFTGGRSLPEVVAILSTILCRGIERSREMSAFVKLRCNNCTGSVLQRRRSDRPRLLKDRIILKMTRPSPRKLAEYL